MMNYFRKLKTVIIIAIVAVMIICSCNRDEVFEREQYKNVFALLSDDGFNIFTETHDLRITEGTGFVSAVCGGSLAIEKDINITMVEDEELLLKYNRSNYELDESKYAQLVPPDKYDITNLNITIPAGERSGLMRIDLRPDGLSPDSVYFIPLRADKFSAYELNPVKSDVLYRVLIKNYYASQNAQNAGTTYNFNGKRDGINIQISKQIFPISRNKVRIVAGDISFVSGDANFINSASLLLEIDEVSDSIGFHIHISPYKEPAAGGITVTQVDNDPNYPNIFRIEDDGYSTYKTFLLRYNFVYLGITYTMHEELRLEFNEENEEKIN
jgi:hypothetical protein